MNSGERIETILHSCLARLEAGEDVAACLINVPQHAAELEPLLTAAADLRRWTPPALSASARASARTRALSAFAEQRQARTIYSGRFGRSGQLVMRYALALVLMLVLLGSSVSFAQASLPGQLLYGLKRGSEQVRLDLAGDAEQSSLYLDFADRRLNEALALLDDGQPLDPDLLRDLAHDYDLAWQSITQAAPELRPGLIARYREEISAHQQLIAAALARTAPTMRAPIEPIMRINRDAAARFALPTPVPATPTPTPTPSRTPTPIPSRTPLPTSPPIPSRTPLPTSPPAPTVTPRPHITRPTVIPAPTQEVEPGASPAPADDHGGANATPEPGDDHGGPNATPEPGDDHGGPSPTDDHGGANATPEPGDDHSGANATPEPGDDHGGANATPEPGDDHGGTHATPEPGDDHGGNNGGSGGK
jgi:Domain of unknown function (DUF5667)